jgi:Mor family transcriptional regulator
MSDIVLDTLQALTDILKAEGVLVRPAQLSAAEKIVKSTYGGDRIYIPHRGEIVQRAISERDEAIRRGFARGERVELLARRHGLTVRRVQQILQLGETNGVNHFAQACDAGQHDSNRPDDRAGNADGRRHRKVAKEPF